MATIPPSLHGGLPLSGKRIIEKRVTVTESIATDWKLFIGTVPHSLHRLSYSLLMRKLRLCKVKSLCTSIPCSKWSVQGSACGSGRLIPVSVFITTFLSLTSGCLRNEVCGQGKLRDQDLLCAPCLVQIPHYHIYSSPALRKAMPLSPIDREEN